MALSCETHTAYLYDRGGRRQIAKLEPLYRIKWERRRDDISIATAFVQAPNVECATALGLIEAGRAEMVVFRGKQRVWEGPVARVSYKGESVEIEARDVMLYVNRTVMHNEYDNRHPNTSNVLDRIKRIMIAEMARKEALDPPINVVSHIQYLYADPTTESEDARTSAHTHPYQLSVFEHVDTYAARGGIDYTVVGRSILFFDVHHRIGQTPMVTKDDFIGDVVITQYGMELATRVIMTDGEGTWGAAGGIDPYYGEWEVLHQAYDEDTKNKDKPDDPPSKAELESQAARSYQQGKVPPLVARVPDNTRLNPNGVLKVDDLVPGVWIPLSAKVPGRTIQQMQKLDSMTVEETAKGGEIISVTLSPAYADSKFVEDDEE
jgi:hypothetical protein